jgi:hypothetical protein
MRLNKALTTSYQDVTPTDEISMSCGRVIELNTFFIANNSNTTTTVNACLVSSIDDAVATEGVGGNQFINAYSIPAGDTLDVLEGSKMTLEGGESIQLKASANGRLDSHVTYSVINRL